jgi:hypothetical protein
MRQAFVATVLASLFVAGPVFAGPIHERQDRQAARIHRGVKSGALTPNEAGALRAEQRHINRTRNRALANDGRIGPAEARRLTREQNVASRDIHRLKHNAATR